MTDATKGCSKQVYTDSYSRPIRACSRKAVVERDGKGYCKQHDPVAIAERRTVSDEERNRKMNARDAGWRYQAAAVAACQAAGLSVESLEQGVVKELAEVASLWGQETLSPFLQVRAHALTKLVLAKSDAEAPS